MAVPGYNFNQMFPQDSCTDPCFGNPINFLYRERFTALTQIAKCRKEHGETTVFQMQEYILKNRFPYEREEMRKWIEIASDKGKIIQHLESNFRAVENGGTVSIAAQVDAAFEKFI